MNAPARFRKQPPEGPLGPIDNLQRAQFPDWYEKASPEAREAFGLTWSGKADGPLLAHEEGDLWVFWHLPEFKTHRGDYGCMRQVWKRVRQQEPPIPPSRHRRYGIPAIVLCLVLVSGWAIAMFQPLGSFIPLSAGVEAAQVLFEEAKDERDHGPKHEPVFRPMQPREMESFQAIFEAIAATLESTELILESIEASVESLYRLLWLLELSGTVAHGFSDVSQDQ